MHFLVFDRPHTPVTVEADILSSLIPFITDFAREQLPKQISKLLVGSTYFIIDFVRKLLEKH